MTTLKACSIDGCDSPRKSRGWCTKHYKRYLRNGDPLKTVISQKGEGVRWVQAVALNPPEGCALWPFGVSSHGYGSVTWDGSRVLAHRLALMLHTVEDPKGRQALHGPCHNPRCCNPLHLSWGTAKENAADRLRDGTDRRGEKSATAKLTEADVILIRKDARPQRAIAQSYGISQSAVWMIKTKKSWEHV